MTFIRQRLREAEKMGPVRSTRKLPDAKDQGKEKKKKKEAKIATGRNTAAGSYFLLLD